MKLQVFTLAAVVLLTACADDRIEQAKASIETLLPDRMHVEYRNLQAFPRGVVCGELSFPDPMWGDSPFRRFIVLNDVAMDQPSEDDWEIFCSEEPAAALQSRLGIGPLNEQAENLAQISRDMNAITTALAAYQDDNFFLPNTAQGLEALSVATELQPQPARFREGGYLAPVPADPWGRPYRYERSGLGGVAHDYALQTLGADGVAGGQGANADISKNQLKYIEFVQK